MATKKRRGTSSRGKQSVDLDFSDVKKFTVPNGTYLVTIVKAVAKKSKSNNDMLELSMEISEGKHEGFEIREYVSLSQNALFRVQALLDGFGYEYKSKGKFTLNVEDLVGLEAYAVVKKEVNDQGYETSRITSYADSSDDEDYDDDEEDDYEDDDEDDEEEEDELDLEAVVRNLATSDLKELSEELGISSKKWKATKAKEAKIKLILNQDEEDIELALDELGLIDDEEDD